MVNEGEQEKDEEADETDVGEGSIGKVDSHRVNLSWIIFCIPVYVSLVSNRNGCYGACVVDVEADLEVGAVGGDDGWSQDEA